MDPDLVVIAALVHAKVQMAALQQLLCVACLGLVSLHHGLDVAKVEIESLHQRLEAANNDNAGLQYTINMLLESSQGDDADHGEEAEAVQDHDSFLDAVSWCVVFLVVISLPFLAW